jgi:hypothetical protein
MIEFNVDSFMIYVEIRIFFHPVNVIFIYSLNFVVIFVSILDFIYQEYLIIFYNYLTSNQDLVVIVLCYQYLNYLFLFYIDNLIHFLISSGFNFIDKF